MDCDRKLLLLVLLLLAVCVAVKAERWGPFLSVNQGDFGEYLTEYGANYRLAPLSTSDGIFQLVFFNTTPNAYTLAIRMGIHERSIMRYVWTANRNHPVSDNATLQFTTTGDLVLSDADGSLVWSSNTSNKGAVQIELGVDGNMVMYDKNNETVWQSFDYPSDTLLVGQSLKIDKVKKLVSRVSEKNGAEGAYSLVMEAGGLALYASFPKHVPYWTLSYYGSERKDLFTTTHACKRPLASITFLTNSDRLLIDGFNQVMEMRLANFSAPPELRARQLCKLTSDEISSVSFSFTAIKFNTTYSFVRLDWDGNLRIYTYSPQVDSNMWDITYKRFECDEGPIYGCGPPRKCGSFGLCQDGNCAACPQPDGLHGWTGTDNCSPPRLPTSTSTSTSTSTASVDFYKVVGAEHFSNRYVAGLKKVTVEECKRRCLGDCKCAAFFYWEESSTCFPTQTLDTLQQLGNTTHLAFIKYVKKL